MPPCPCGNPQSFEMCCQPLINGSESAKTAEALMRSRYTAFVYREKEYLHKTWYQKRKIKEGNLLSENIRWLKLEILHTDKGQPQDNQGIVEFKASYMEDGQLHVLHEKSNFKKIDGNWLYLNGVHL